MSNMSKEQVKHHQEELQRRILKLIQDFELKTDWRVEAIGYNPATSTVRIAVKQPPNLAPKPPRSPAPA